MVSGHHRDHLVLVKVTSWYEWHTGNTNNKWWGSLPFPSGSWQQGPVMYKHSSYIFQEKSSSCNQKSIPVSNIMLLPETPVELCQLRPQTLWPNEQQWWLVCPLQWSLELWALQPAHSASNLTMCNYMSLSNHLVGRSTWPLTKYLYCCLI